MALQAVRDYLHNACSLAWRVRHEEVMTACFGLGAVAVNARASEHAPMRPAYSPSTVRRRASGDPVRRTEALEQVALGSRLRGNERSRRSSFEPRTTLYAN